MRRVVRGLALALRLTVGAFGLGLLLVAMWLLAFATAAPLSLGWTPVLIVSNSMEPAISEGDVILIAEPERLGIGSVVTFESVSEGRLITHRIVAVDAAGNYLTRGDANPTNDSTPVSPDMIYGQARILVPMAGLPWLWVTEERWGAVIIALIALCASAGVARWALEGGVVERLPVEPGVAETAHGVDDQAVDPDPVDLTDPSEPASVALPPTVVSPVL